MLIRKRGQSVLEYAILMVIIIAALITLQGYIKRGIQGRLKKATDDIGSQYTTNKSANYNKWTKTTSKTNTVTTGGVVETKMIDDTITNSRETIDTNSMGESWN